MRVTNNMVANQTVFNMQNSLSRFLDLETSASSGRRINKPSDDPVGVQRDLDYRRELALNAQLQKNIGSAQNWLLAYDSIHNELKNFVQTAKEVAITMSNGTYDSVARDAAASEIASIYEQVLQLANTEREGRRIFSGFKTDTAPLRASANGVVYDGDFGKIQYQIDSAARLPVNLNGSEAFLKQVTILGEHEDLDVGITGATLLTDLHNGLGIDTTANTFTITDRNLGVTSTVDITGDVTVSDLLNSINTQLTADGINNLTAEIAESRNGLVFRTTPNPRITVSTALDKLNQGHGVDMTIGKILVTGPGGENVTVNLQGAQTVGDAIIAFNNQLTAAGINNVLLEITSLRALKITDSNIPPLDLTVSEVDPASKTAEDLGILGFVGPLLVGENLNPELSFEITDTTGQVASDLGILGEFANDFAGSDIDPRLQAANSVQDLNVGNGFELGEIVMWQGEIKRTIDLGDSTIATVQDVLDAFNNSGLNITASINADGRGIQIVNNDPTRSLTLEDTDGGTTAKDLGIYGAADMVGTLIVLENALRADDREGAERLLQSLDDSIQLLLNNRATVGARSIRLDSTSTRLTDLELSLTKSLSEVEDADLTKVLTDLATYENNYQSALMATAKIIQPSLLDFLR